MKTIFDIDRVEAIQLFRAVFSMWEENEDELPMGPSGIDDELTFEKEQDYYGPDEEQNHFLLEWSIWYLQISQSLQVVAGIRNGDKNEPHAINVFALTHTIDQLKIEPID
ncbi:hypothetical protein [Spirosoma sp. KNUC1025]|uniref:hypothetical protein n=1 Tax=Spirosoma sp. KNUC1025 TaxID=2894082 RepID=UPI001E3F70FD|nr:hypothetical protein [Spirosoma sp. KNUC1025]UFH57713.1 hypothetical protein LN737_32310 [Spirosoma sp. KNUC1025]